MKLKNIALGIGFLAAMFSCSMEEDIASDTKGKVDGVSEDLYAALQFNISTGTDLSTKATTEVTGPAEDSDYSEMENSTEMAVNECLFLLQTEIILLDVGIMKALISQGRMLETKTNIH